MRIPLRLPGKKAKTPKPPTALDVLRAELAKAYELHPAYLMPGSIVTALEEAGFTIISHDDLDREIALAYAAGAVDAEA